MVMNTGSGGSLGKGHTELLIHVLPRAISVFSLKLTLFMLADF